MTASRIGCTLAMLTMLACGVRAAADSAGAAETVDGSKLSARQRALETRLEQSTGDLDVLLAHRMIRMLVPYSPTLFYHDHGHARGVVADAAAQLEKYLNHRFPDKRPFTVVLIPTTRDRLLQGLNDGEGDVAAGSLTITVARLERYDFTTPTFSDVNQVFVTGPDAPELRSLEDMAGQTVYVRKSKSFYDNLVALNARFEHPDPPIRPLPPMQLALLPDELESEDVLDMVDAGLIPIAVCEEWLASIWADHLPKLVVRRDLVLREGTDLGWAMRKSSPKLKAVLDDFIRTRRSTGFFKSLLHQADVDVGQMLDATGKQEREKFDATIDVFRQYAQQYEFDYLMLAAQGYQESRLDQSARSKSGAIGIMQLMPSTGASMKVGDIKRLDPNVHAATKYMAHLMETYFKDAKFDEQNRTLFAFASYNAGPGNIAKVRARARADGVDPNVWFNQVERVAARTIGQEPVVYVRNVFKYYVAYKLAHQTETERVEALERLKNEPNGVQDDNGGN